jgi:hypothetical protein
MNYRAAIAEVEAKSASTEMGLRELLKTSHLDANAAQAKADRIVLELTADVARKESLIHAYSLTIESLSDRIRRKYEKQTFDSQQTINSLRTEIRKLRADYDLNSLSRKSLQKAKSSAAGEKSNNVLPSGNRKVISLGTQTNELGCEDDILFYSAATYPGEPGSCDSGHSELKGLVAQGENLEGCAVEMPVKLETEVAADQRNPASSPSSLECKKCLKLENRLGRCKVNLSAAMVDIRRCNDQLRMQTLVNAKNKKEVITTKERLVSVTNALKERERECSSMQEAYVAVKKECSNLEKELQALVLESLE